MRRSAGKGKGKQTARDALNHQIYWLDVQLGDGIVNRLRKVQRQRGAYMSKAGADGLLESELRALNYSREDRLLLPFTEITESALFAALPFFVILFGFLFLHSRRISIFLYAKQLSKKYRHWYAHVYSRERRRKIYRRSFAHTKVRRFENGASTLNSSASSGKGYFIAKMNYYSSGLLSVILAWFTARNFRRRTPLSEHNSRRSY